MASTAGATATAIGTQRMGGRDRQWPHLERITGNAASGDRLPMIVALHGLGDRPEQFVQLFEGFPAPARLILLRAPDRHGSGYSWFPFRPSGDSEERRARLIAIASDRIAPVIDALAAHRPTIGRPIVTGFSQGGMLSFALAVRHPATISAAFPIGGLLPAPLRPEAGASVAPLVALHGGADTVVPIESTQQAVRSMQTAGFRASLRQFPRAGHHVPPEMRRTLFELLAEACAREANDTR